MEEPPVVVTMEQVNGQVALQEYYVLHNQKPQMFESNPKPMAKKRRGTVLCDNIRDFLVNMELAESRLAQAQNTNNRECVETEVDRVYVLGDGTQIRASQIHFDNEEPLVDLTKETIPFIKYTTDTLNETDTLNVHENYTKTYKITDNPDKIFGDNATNSFANTLPFIPITNNYEAQFTKFVANSTRTSKVCRDKSKNHDNVDIDRYRTRESILNMLKDTAVDVKPHDTETMRHGDKPVKRKHARKSDPTKLEPICRLKRLTSVNETKQSNANDQLCSYCGVLIQNEKEKYSLFDKGSTEKILNINTLNASLAQLKKHAPIKTICLQCLNANFKRSEVSLDTLNDNRLVYPDEYIVINDNKQYVYRKTNTPNLVEDMNNNSSLSKSPETNSINIDMLAKSLARVAEQTRIKDKNKIEKVPEEKVNEETNVIRDETVISLLDHNETGGKEAIELKCRFCSSVFQSMCALETHASEHRFTVDEEDLYPCPLCDYGFSDLTSLTEHLRNSHESGASKASPKENDCMGKDASNEEADKEKDCTQNTVCEMTTEIKVESGSSDDEGVWIVQTMDDGGDTGMVSLLGAAVAQNDKNSQGHNEEIACNSDNTSSKISAMQGKSVRYKRSMVDGRKRKLPAKESQAHVTCHDCNERFTSKVRLRFHLQFHASPPSAQLTADGRFACPACPLATFDTDSQLFDHVHFQHTREKFWKCRVHGCGKSFHLKATLTKHGRAHTGTRRYVCGDCGKKFLDKQTLDEHGVTHLKIKPYKCHICLKQLTRRSRLRMHLRAHLEEPTPRLVMVCRFCTQAFRDHEAAQDHVTSSLTCVEELSKQLEQKPQLAPCSGQQPTSDSALVSPVKWQVDSSEASQLLSRLDGKARDMITIVQIDKALRCEFCELVFYTEEGLNKHREIHKGVPNPYICHICKVSFSTYSRCTTHKTTHGFFKRSMARQEYNSPVLGYSDFPVVKHFLCEVCGRSYLHWTYLQVHRRNKHSPRGLALTCTKCHITFTNSWALASHKKYSQCTNEDLEEACVVYERGCDDQVKHEYDLTAGNGVKEGYRIQCRDCEAVLPSKTELYRHRNKAHRDYSLMNYIPETETANSLDWDRQMEPSSGPQAVHRVRRLPAPHLARDRVRVLQVSGGLPQPQQVLLELMRQGLDSQRVRSVAAFSYVKGSTGIIPDCARSVRLLGAGVPLPLPPQHHAPPKRKAPRNHMETLPVP